MSLIYAKKKTFTALIWIKRTVFPIIIEKILEFLIFPLDI